MSRRTLIMLACGSLAMAGCGSDPAGGTPDAADSTTVDAAPDASPDGWTTLIARTWAVPVGGGDSYKCTRIAVPSDMYIAGFRTISPAGTHHTVLTIADKSGGALGDYDCNAGSLDLQMLYASGVGTDDLLFPDGRAIKVAGGSVLNLNLHLFNVSDQDLAGESGVQVKLVPAAAVDEEVEMIFAGTENISIAADGAPHTASGGCTASSPYTILALWPHMHQLATHQLVELTQANGTSVLLDENYSFANQHNYPQDPPIVISAGDQLRVTCTYENTAGSTVYFGDSSHDEMCFTGLYRYPASGAGLFGCVGP